MTDYDKLECSPNTIDDDQALQKNKITVWHIVSLLKVAIKYSYRIYIHL